MANPGLKPKLYQPIKTSIVLEQAHYNYISELADQYNLSISAVLRQIIDAHMLSRAKARLEARGIDNG
jgi:predicted DNA-binding ribbon-helix-helix protein